MPAQAGIRTHLNSLGSRLRGNDGSGIFQRYLGSRAMTTDLFSAEKYVASRRPLAQASPLPGWCYVSPEWHAREMETIFRGANSEWLCVGRVDQIPNPGDFYTIPVLGQPLIVVRDKDGSVNVLSAI